MLLDGSRKLGVTLNEFHLEQFAAYRRLVLEWNEHFNLTAITKKSEVDIRHFLDSISLASFLGEAKGIHLIDVGSGAGFPGLPLKIVQQELHLVLVESVRKKADFLEHVIERLALKDCEVICARAEEIGQSVTHRERYDVATARAVANLSILAEYLLPLVGIGGTILAPKGKAAHQEVQQAENAVKILGGQLYKVVPVEIPGLAEDRYVVIINKVAATPEKYPRRAGMANKRPL